MKRNTSVLSSPTALFKEAQILKNSSIEAAVKKAQEALVLAQELNEYSLEVDILVFLGRTLRIKGEAFASIEQLNKAYRILNDRFSKETQRYSFIYREYGSLYSDYFNDHDTALDYFRKSLSLSNDEILPPLYNNIGCQYVLLKDYDKATAYLSKGKDICLERKEYTTLSFVFENFGQMYFQEKNRDAAIAAYESGVEAAKTALIYSDDVQLVNYIHCYNLIGIAKTYLQANEYDKLPQLIQAIYDKSIASKLQSCWSEVAIIDGSMLLKNNKIEAFTELFERASQFCTENGLYSDKGIWLQKMINLCEKQNRYKDALNYSKKLIENKADKESKTKAVSIAKVLENKEQEILALENRNHEMLLQKKQLEQFAYIVAHDLKTPISNISNFVGLFLKKFKDKVDEENKDYLNFIQVNSRKLNLMFDELLKYVSIEDVKEKVPYCNVESLITRICKRYKDQIVDKNGIIEFDSLPQVKMHAPHLEIILDRMIENGIKFSRKNRDLHLLIEVKENEDECRFIISDNGIGISEVYHKKVFDLFQQLDKVNFKGTGMGLAICKKIVEMYGGKIEISTNDLGGTSFEFNIPK